MADEFIKAKEVTFEPDGLEILTTCDKLFKVPYSKRLKQATRAQRRDWRLIAGGMGIHWPEIDEDLNVDELYREHLSANPLMRSCRFCGERSRWDAETCESCGKERWNDPDDTALGKALGEAERTNYEIARARVKVDRAYDKLKGNDD